MTMAEFHFLVLLSTTLWTTQPVDSQPSAPAPEMLRALDGMQFLMTGTARYDRQNYQDFRDCMAQLDPSIPAVQDRAWKGVQDYWDSNRNSLDRWGTTESGFRERNITKVPVLNNMEVYEPCGFASNIAYLFSMKELCLRQKNKPLKMPSVYVNSIGKALSHMATASSFFHASLTKLGFQQDQSAISSIFYACHQASVSALPYTSFSHDLSATRRTSTSSQMVDSLQEMYSNKPSSEWFEITKSLKQPAMVIPAAAFILQAINLNFNNKKTIWLSNRLLDAFNFTVGDKLILIDNFLPFIQNITNTNKFPKKILKQVRKNSLAVVFKLFHALLYNEFFLRFEFLIENKFIRYITNMIYPKFTKKLNVISDYEYYQPHFQKSANIYPGEHRCNRDYPHARWHVISALSLVDFVYLSEELNALYSSRRT